MTPASPRPLGIDPWFWQVVQRLHAAAAIAVRLDLDRVEQVALGIEVPHLESVAPHDLVGRKDQHPKPHDFTCRERQHVRVVVAPAGFGKQLVDDLGERIAAPKVRRLWPLKRRFEQLGIAAAGSPLLCRIGEPGQQPRHAGPLLRRARDGREIADRGEARALGRGGLRQADIGTLQHHGAVSGAAFGAGDDPADHPGRRHVNHKIGDRIATTPILRDIEAELGWGLAYRLRWIRPGGAEHQPADARRPERLVVERPEHRCRGRDLVADRRPMVVEKILRKAAAFDGVGMRVGHARQQRELALALGGGIGNVRPPDGRHRAGGQRVVEGNALDAVCVIGRPPMHRRRGRADGADLGDCWS